VIDRAIWFYRLARPQLLEMDKIKIIPNRQKPSFSYVIVYDNRSQSEVAGGT
jgi:hypothetical protein